MKRIAGLILAFCLCVGICGCKSPTQKELEDALRTAAAAEEAADAAWAQYDRLLELKEQYEDAQEKISSLTGNHAARKDVRSQLYFMHHHHHNSCRYFLRYSFRHGWIVKYFYRK